MEQESNSEALAVDALVALGIDLDEAYAMAEDLREVRRRDDRICICGHSLSRHKDASGFISCKPSKYDCPCKKIRPVIRTSDARYFMRKNHGDGMLHALVSGIATAQKHGATVEWIVDLACDKCGAPGRVTVSCVTSNGYKDSTASSGYNVLLCDKCYGEL